jgi:hypothetical protein
MRAVPWALAPLLMLGLWPGLAEGMPPGVVTHLYAVFDGSGAPGNASQLQAVEPPLETEAIGQCGSPGGEGLVSDPVWALPFRAGPVESDFVEGGAPRFHPEEGLAADITLQSARLLWSLDLPDDTHLAVPLRLRAEIREGSPEQPGDLVAQGETPGIAALAGIVDLVVPLEVVGDGRVEKAEGFTLLVWLEDGKDCASPETLRAAAVSRSGHRSRLEVATEEGVYIEFVHPQVAAGILLIHAAFNSPFGAADLDRDNLTLRVEGPSTPQAMQRVVSQNDHVHGLHDLPVEVTWLWRFRDEGALPGDYALEVTVTNRAGTSTASLNASFHVSEEGAHGVDDEGSKVPPQDEDAQAAPSAAIPFLAVAALAAATVRRRWR